ncbi:1-phosphofructokinase family hexose kinase [Paenibacillus agricola]|uniref:Tagatose-6-phosphate kinase n=1 Tax=Paenibacillus agricola TaxID=2716264 RepID=A0ABX0JDW7_9BACL|nr:1-phosphofructokinase family hexose kinase [Paenibacillus agricola]NHN33451.1 1-phosphofructokinase family hexose kinase [Paenibacillus agricola]
MITTVTLNAAIDKTYYLPSFGLGQVSRVQRMFAEPGGKGINVARVIQQLGYPVIATGFVGGHNGRFIENALSQQGIEHDFIHVEGESRLCLNVIEESKGSSTELLEQGPVISEEAWQLMQAKLAHLAARSRIVCFSGSLPQGVPDDGYAQLIAIVKQAGCLAFLDTSGSALLQGIKALPDFVKPNEDEVRALLTQVGWLRAGVGFKIEADTGVSTRGEVEASDDPETGTDTGTGADSSVSTEAVIRTGLLHLHSQGLPIITISLGSEGSVSVYAGALHRIKAPCIQPVNTVGCGDAFVAGMAIATAQGLPFQVCLERATAAASANALTDRAGNVHPDDVERLLAAIAATH